MPVTDYKLLIERDYPAGTLVTPSSGKTHTRFNNTGGILYHGVGVARGSLDYRAIKYPPTLTTDVFEGIVMHTNTYEVQDGITRDPATGLIGYPDKREVSIIRPSKFTQVAVWVDSVTAVNDPVFWRFTNTPGSTGVGGCFRKDADTDKAVQIQGARFIKAVAAPSAGKMAISIIEFN